MDLSTITDSNLFTLVILPLLIVLARICDVTLGTIRIMFISRGHKFLAPILGFFEILIWLLAIRQIFQNLTNIICYIAYASGFALGNFIGILIDEKIAMGKRVVRIITGKDATALIRALSRKGFGVTNIPAKGARGKVNVVYTVVERSDIERVIHIIEKFNPKAFYSIEDVRAVKEGIFPSQKGLGKRFYQTSKIYRRLSIYWRYWRIRKAK